LGQSPTQVFTAREAQPGRAGIDRRYDIVRDVSYENIGQG
jgi:hypothetical protein